MRLSSPATLIIQTALFWRPPPDLKMSEWAERYRYLSPESSSKPGRWKNSTTPYLVGIMDAISDPRNSEVTFMSSSQVGKALDVATPILTCDGWKTMGEIFPGDFVFGFDGRPTLVKGVSNVFYDHACFLVRFSDESEIVADADHLWTVDVLAKGTKTLSTKEMSLNFKAPSGGDKVRNRYSIPMQNPIRGEDSSLLVDPYLLGIWLGDGHGISATIHCTEGDGLEYKPYFEENGYSVSPNKEESSFTLKVCYGNGRNTFMRQLTKLGVFKNKHIPEEYLKGSVAQRTALLQGLMDTDGHITKRGRCEFSTSCLGIKKGFCELLSGLGIKFTVNEFIPSFAYLGETRLGKLSYRFSFLCYKDFPVFRLPRKLIRQPDKTSRSSQTFTRWITDIIPVESRPTKCILVEAEDHLFLAGEKLVPTHNSECCSNTVGYFMHQDPCPILNLQPTLEMAQTWSKDRLSTMVRDSPVLRGLIKDPKGRNSNNTILHKQFPGGAIAIVGANSPSGLASRPIRVVLADEIDRYPLSAGTEGDPLTLVEARTTTFWNRKIVKTSTPTIAGASRIEMDWLRSDQRRYFVPCPHCQHYQHLEWGRIKWTEYELDPKDAVYQCESCEGKIPNSLKKWMLERGEWRATNPDGDHPGFHIWTAYSPWKTFGD
ncbi:MAG: phage terminase large subunit family protein, partial [Microcoleus sp.]